MTNKIFKEAKKIALLRLHEDKEKELHCHVQFVLKVGLELAKKYHADEKVIELSCLLHDVGRDHEMDNEDHGDSGARISAELLKNCLIPKQELSTILSCIQMHTKKAPNYTLEQKIIITADNASKVIYHEAFMLLCKKQTFEERLAWGLKYLEKGYKNTLFPEYKKNITDRYKLLKHIYSSVESLSV